MKIVNLCWRYCIILLFVFCFNLYADASFLVSFVPTSIKENTQYSLKGSKIKNIDGKFGLVNQRGRVVIPFIYDKIDRLIFPQHLLVQKGDEISLLNLKGKVVKRYDCELVKQFRGGYAVMKKNGKFGTIDFDGNVVIPPVYSQIIHCANNVYFLCNPQTSILSDRYGNRSALYDKYTDFGYDGFETINAIRHSDRKMVCFDLDLDLINCARGAFEQLGNNCLMIKKNGKYGIMNYNCDTLLRCEYDHIETFWCNRSFVRKDDKVALIDDKCNFLTKFTYKHICDLEEEGYALSYLDGVFGIIGSMGNCIKEPQYSMLFKVNKEPFQYEYWRHDGSSGLLTLKNGKVIRDNKNYYVRFRKNGLYGIRSRKGRPVVTPKYETLKKYTKKDSQYYGYYVTKNKDGSMTTIAFPSGQPLWVMTTSDVL